MPQLDFGTFLNQTSAVLGGFWALTFLFFFVFLNQGTWLMKFRTKLGLLRQLLNSLYMTQTQGLETEAAGVQLITTIQTLDTANNLVGPKSNNRFDMVLASYLEVYALTAEVVTPVEVFNDLTLVLPEELA